MRLSGSGENSAPGSVQRGTGGIGGARAGSAAGRRLSKVARGRPYAALRDGVAGEEGSESGESARAVVSGHNRENGEGAEAGGHRQWPREVLDGGPGTTRSQALGTGPRAQRRIAERSESEFRIHPRSPEMRARTGAAARSIHNGTPACWCGSKGRLRYKSRWSSASDAGGLPRSQP
jgi:hypothetical protein